MTVRLQDKYEAAAGRVVITGTQALVRALFDQSRIDAIRGIRTAGFVSGYRGSPLGGLDIALWKVKKELRDASINFEPGVNEELAATAVWGTQQLASVPGARVQGVYAMWYGKGPGVDRAGDAIRHGNTWGSTPYGGVLLVFGDDHPGKSSTLAHHSEHTVASFSVPILYPATVQEVLDFSLYGWALSRYSGCWSALKLVNETAERTEIIHIDPVRHTHISQYGLNADAEPSSGRYDVVGDDIRLQRHRFPRSLDFARAQPLDARTLGDDRATLGIVAAGKSYLDVLEGLRLLGIDERRAPALGLALYKVGMIFPLEPMALRQFARGKAELLFVEEKKAFLEPQAASILFNLPEHERPLITGKLSEGGDHQLPSDVQLAPELIAELVATRLRRVGKSDDAIAQKLQKLRSLRERRSPAIIAGGSRAPYFCAGCPHNRSTVVPEGSIAFSGIGCHGMASWMERRTALPTQMGGEGMNWVGMSRFTETPHIFQNMGDGTFYHSGLLAIRGAVSADTSITFKILVNDAVAMTGGQPVEGQLGVRGIVESLAAEGVRRIAVITAYSPDRYKDLRRSSPKVTLHHRDNLSAVQMELRAYTGVSAIVYDQACAAELRRKRKRGTSDDPDRRVFINSAVCEGCGDCSSQSNCVAIVPIETDWGRKREIDQSTCNKDFSCLRGFCPAMVTIHGANGVRLRRSPIDMGALESIAAPNIQRESGDILITGIGGTGVVTVGAILCMAAHLEGKGATAFDMTGLAQKGGAVFSHVRIRAVGSRETTSKIGVGCADLIIGGDLIASSDVSALSTIGSTTKCVLNTHYIPTGAFQAHNDVSFNQDALLDRLTERLSPDHLYRIDASIVAQRFFGTTLLANTVLLGFALQKGWLPVREDSLRSAIRMNGESVSDNLLAFDIGRLAAADALQSDSPFRVAGPNHAAADLPEFIRSREAFLTEYQNARYARRFAAFVNTVRHAEATAYPGSERLTWAVARALSQLMAYKDEYEVARLFSSARFRQKLDSVFTGVYSVHYHMAPPMLARTETGSDVPRKMQIGPWLTPLLHILTRLKFLRGTPWDPFGWTRERRQERQLIETFCENVRQILDGLSEITLDQAVAVIECYMGIRGFGHVKERNRVSSLENVERMMKSLTEGNGLHRDAIS